MPIINLKMQTICFSMIMHKNFKFCSRNFVLKFHAIPGNAKLVIN